MDNSRKVFLGGTCNKSKWRNHLISLLHIDYFNPVVPNWTEECMARERQERELCDYCLYVITPRINGLYSIAEIIDDSNKRPEKTIFCVLSKDYEYFSNNDFTNGTLEFSSQYLKSLEQVGKMVERNGGLYFTNLNDVASYLNKN